MKHRVLANEGGRRRDVTLEAEIAVIQHERLNRPLLSLKTDSFLEPPGGA